MLQDLPIVSAALSVLAALAVAVSLSGCNPAALSSIAAGAATVGAAVTIPSRVERDCKVAAWASPYLDRLVVDAQLPPVAVEVAGSVRNAVSACAAGDAPTALSEIVKGGVAVLYAARRKEPALTPVRQ